MSQTSREQFEEWVKVRAVGTPAGFHQRLLKHCPLDEKKYSTSWVDAAWEGWQASRELRSGDVDMAAKALAESMDYPWEFMPEQGRTRMRANARMVLEAAAFLEVQP